MRALLILLVVAGAARADEDEEMGRRVQALLHAHQVDVFGCVQAKEEGEALLHVVVGEEHLGAKVEVLKADASVQTAASCVATRARKWDLSSLHASTGDQVVFPLAFRPEGPRADALSVHVAETTLPKNEARDHAVALYVLDGEVTSAQCKAKSGDVLLSPVALTGNAHVVRVDALGGGVPAFRCVTGGALDKLPLLGGQGTVQLALDGSGAPFAIDHLCAKKGAVIPRHEHDSDEVVYVISGHVRSEIGTQTSTSGPHDVVTIPRHTPHSMQVLDDMCAVQVYAPAGPEQRFKVKH